MQAVSLCGASVPVSIAGIQSAISIQVWAASKTFGLVRRQCKILLCIAIGGAAGALARYALSEVIKHTTGAGFPWGTLCVNLLGCFLIGMAVHLVTLPAVPFGLDYMIVIGFLGAFTTFSTFSLESINMLRDGEFTRAGLYILASNIAGIALGFVGFTVGHKIHYALK